MSYEELRWDAADFWDWVSMAMTLGFSQRAIYQKGKCIFCVKPYFSHAQNSKDSTLKQEGIQKEATKIVKEIWWHGRWQILLCHE